MIAFVAALSTPSVKLTLAREPAVKEYELIRLVLPPLLLMGNGFCALPEDFKEAAAKKTGMVYRPHRSRGFNTLFNYPLMDLEHAERPVYINLQSIIRLAVDAGAYECVARILEASTHHFWNMQAPAVAECEVLGFVSLLAATGTGLHASTTTKAALKDFIIASTDFVLKHRVAHLSSRAPPVATEIRGTKDLARLLSPLELDNIRDVVDLNQLVQYFHVDRMLLAQGTATDSPITLHGRKFAEVIDRMRGQMPLHMYNSMCNEDCPELRRCRDKGRNKARQEIRLSSQAKQDLNAAFSRRQQGKRKPEVLAPSQTQQSRGSPEVKRVKLDSPVPWQPPRPVSEFDPVKMEDEAAPSVPIQLHEQPEIKREELEHGVELDAVPGQRPSGPEVKTESEPAVDLAAVPALSTVQDEVRTAAEPPVSRACVPVQPAMEGEITSPTAPPAAVVAVQAQPTMWQGIKRVGLLRYWLPVSATA